MDDNTSNTNRGNIHMGNHICNPRELTRKEWWHKTDEELLTIKIERRDNKIRLNVKLIEVMNARKQQLKLF